MELSYFRKYIMFTINDLVSAFDNNLDFAWQLLHAEILFDSYPVNTQHLKNLITLYSKGLQKFNSCHLPNQNYFKLKINQLMGQRKVIHCLHTHRNHPQKINKKEEPSIKQLSNLHTKIHNNNQLYQPIPHYQPTIEKKTYQPAIDRTLQTRRQELQLRMAFDIEESKNQRVGKMLLEEAERTQRLKGLVKTCMEEEQDKLKKKIMRRRTRVSGSTRLGFSLKLEERSESTLSEWGERTPGQWGEGRKECVLREWDGQEDVLNDMSFTSSNDGELIV